MSRNELKAAQDRRDYWWALEAAAWEARQPVLAKVYDALGRVAWAYVTAVLEEDPSRFFQRAIRDLTPEVSEALDQMCSVTDGAGELGVTL